MNTKEIAEKMVREQDFQDARLPEAGLYGVLETGETFLIGNGFDVYHLLSQEIDSPLQIAGLAVTTSGWAAPLNENGKVDGQPSQHPERKRVLLVALVTAEEILSAMRFADDEEIITDTGGAGSLADALREAFDRISA